MAIAFCLAIDAIILGVMWLLVGFKIAICCVGLILLVVAVCGIYFRVKG